MTQAPTQAPTNVRTHAPLSGRRIRLRSIFPADYEYLYALATHEDTGWRWRYRGMTPSFEQFVGQLHENVLVQFLVEHRETQQRIGHVLAFDADLRNGWCHIAMIIDPMLKKMGWALEAGTLFVNYLFTGWNLRKLYGLTPEFSFNDIASGTGNWFREEGRLRDHEWHNGRYWDTVMLALWRSDWEGYGPTLLAKVTLPDEGA
jgi:RimJ/RimL family protein N-acetyltransferase